MLKVKSLLGRMNEITASVGRLQDDSKAKWTPRVHDVNGGIDSLVKEIKVSISSNEEWNGRVMCEVCA